jgi:hypothetical protein
MISARINAIDCPKIMLDLLDVFANIGDIRDDHSVNRWFGHCGAVICSSCPIAAVLLAQSHMHSMLWLVNMTYADYYEKSSAGGKMPANPELKARIRSALVANGISQNKFSAFAGLNPQTVSRYLTGKTWRATTEHKLERALARLPKRKSPKHRRINLEERPNGKA